MQRKNLLYIFADQWRYHAVGAAHEDTVFTPHMDAFAAESVCCTNAISTYPLCSPHRAALLTGKYPLSCGMWTNCKTGLDISPCLAPQETLIGDVLRGNGYDTAYIGKWHLDSSDLNYSAHPASGCSGWDAYTPAGCRRHGFDFWYSYGAMDEHLSPHYWTTDGERRDIHTWSPEHETDVLLSYLECRRSAQPAHVAGSAQSEHTAQANKPFCAFLSWNPPHPPYDQVPQPYLERYAGELRFRQNVPEAMRRDESYRKKMREYYAAVSGLDEQFGRIMDFLEKKGLKDDTLIVLSADHGDCMGSHGLYGKNIWYEESVRIPLYVGGGAMFSFAGEGADTQSRTSAAAGLHKPLVCPALIESCDHMPTLLDILDIPIPDCVEGTSAAPALAAAVSAEKKAGGGLSGGTASSYAGKTHAFLCMLPGMPELIEPFKKEGLDSKCFGWRGIRTADKTYVIDNGTAPHTKQRRLLYDNVNDPYQMHPVELLPSDPRCEPYDELLRAWCAEYKDYFLFKAVD